MGLRHSRRQVAGTEQPRFEDFLGVEFQAVKPADQDSLVIDLDPVPEAAADLEQPARLDGEPGFLADLPGDGVLVPLALVRVPAQSPYWPDSGRSAVQLSVSNRSATGVATRCR